VKKENDAYAALANAGFFPAEPLDLTNADNDQVAKIVTVRMKEAHDHSRVSPEGRALGEQMARLYDIALARLGDEADQGERCKTCAFRAGTVPNGCAQTQMDISKCAAEGIPFYCHQHRGELCHGWIITRIGLADVLPGLAHLTKDTPLSPPDSQRHIVDAAEAKRERRAEKRRQIAARQAAKRSAP
jgi:hypothetical protein